MTREQAKELLPIITAFADGKKVQFFHDEWLDLTSPTFATCLKWRIKPEPREWTVRKHHVYGMITGQSGPILNDGEVIRVREILD